MTAVAPAPTRAPADPAATVVIACGALGPELATLLARSGLEHLVALRCLPPSLHDTPEHIPDLVRGEVRAVMAAGGTAVVGYADCGTGGRLDAVCVEEGVERLPGAHCYELFAGSAAFAQLHAAEPGTFYLTDFLVRSFDRLVIRGLGLDRHPQLRDAYFGNYRRLIHLAQRDDPELDRRARDAAVTLGLTHQRVVTGLGPFAQQLDHVLDREEVGA